MTVSAEELRIRRSR